MLTSSQKQAWATFAVVLAVGVVILAISLQFEKPDDDEDENFVEQSSILAGDLNYSVNQSAWDGRLVLAVRLFVYNNGSAPRTTAPVNLLDDRGRIYEPSGYPIARINPGQGEFIEARFSASNDSDFWLVVGADASRRLRLDPEEIAPRS